MLWRFCVPRVFSSGVGFLKRDCGLPLSAVDGNRTRVQQDPFLGCSVCPSLLPGSGCGVCSSVGSCFPSKGRHSGVLSASSSVSKIA